MKGAKPPRVAFVNLGCAKNMVDSEVMMARLAGRGVVLTDSFPVDAVVVNTCGFIQEAKEESLEEIFRVVRLKEEGLVGKVLVGGCLSQRYMEELRREIPEVDRFFGLAEISSIDSLLVEVLGDEGKGLSDPCGDLELLYQERASLVSSPWTYLKITEGCSNRCTYCTIPLIRGDVKSRLPESVEREFDRLVSRGVREVNIVGQDITVYGRDLSPPLSLPELLWRLSRRAPDDLWIRLLYLHPRRVTDELVAAMREVPQVVPYADIPIQHASDRVLERMGRGYTKDDLRELVSMVRREIPGVVLRTTVLLGFPGEEERDVEELLEFIREVRFDRLGGFVYSREEGTAAFEMEGQVPREAARERLEEVMTLQAEISLEKNREFLGRIVDVLVEEGNSEGGVGRFSGQAPEVDGVVRVNSRRPLGEGEVVAVRVTGFDHYDLEGELFEERKRD
ncbi:MAG: 30S ribosomal protein S12 methylthiotransferase RimO [Deltaproteobacteria bacterium]|nr:MAG: 30S ribosomal protein S12 methylthiotransferase RimO [Deltaproteobacteria bacterium]